MVGVVFLVGWALFSYGYLWQSYVNYGGSLSPLWYLVALNTIVSPLALGGLARLLWQRQPTLWPRLRALLEAHTEAIDSLALARIGLWVALAAGLALYTELMIIRVHSSAFQLFSYFKNVSLLSCFLGLGIGYTMEEKRPLTTPLVLPLLALQIAALHLMRFTGVAEALQNPISEQLAFGIGQASGVGHIAIVYGFLSMMFAFNALTFIPLGHLTARLMTRQPKLVAYGWNLLGSLAGILLFSFVSFLWSPPAVWILLSALGLLTFLHRERLTLLWSSVAALALLALLSMSFKPNQYDVYSPYQVLTLQVLREDHHVIQVNNVYYQRILDLSEDSTQNNAALRQSADNYSLPYLLKAAPEEVLIVGSGTGNDVAAALRYDAGRVDAVEIDPAILAFGKSLHAESPYQSDKVTAIVNDARSFIRHTDNQYDLIVYGLLDSHTLLSGRSGVRLDSFVYTVEAFRETRARLKEGGLISLSFSLIRPELGRKLYLMLEEAFDGTPPVVYQTGYDGGYTFLIGEGITSAALPIPEGVRDATADFADPSIRADKSTDDWPFLYMPVRKYPVSYMLLIALLLVISLAFIVQFVPGAGRSLSVPCFFLGAGFMLIETKGITELALVYGSTWVVISAVIASILMLAFVANWLVQRFGAPRPVITYGLIFLALAAGLAISSSNLSGLPISLTQLVLTVALTLPLLFSGFAFSVELDKAASVGSALSSNLLGAMLGGFLEYNSMYFGFRSLYLIAFAMYALAFIGALRRR